MLELKVLKSRAELMFRLYSVFESELWLWRWFKAEVNVVKKEGLVDVKFSLFVDRDTTTAGAVLTLATGLRLRRQGKLTPFNVH